eukprot:Nitzschia sp. Nitz4//scaffold389_size11954//6654//7164//NITZ4_009010-RA/size11954-augustus-gene-0.10-mRNA-1//1//CDS//3329549993//4939//frame0
MSSTSSKSNSSVSFDEVTIYWFPAAIGDNPACREGCPIRIGDKYIYKETVDVELYEDSRGERVQKNDLYLEVPERAAMLMDNGYPIDAIVHAVLEVDAVRKCRSENMKLNSVEKINVAMDTAGKTLRKLVIGSKGPKQHSVQARSA